jgi:hypothetical protein
MTPIKLLTMKDYENVSLSYTFIGSKCIAIDVVFSY